MTHYIDKSALVAEINRVLDSYDPNEITSGRYALVDFTLEVKEVDLKKEIQSWVEDNSVNGYYQEDVYETAKHFFELGLKAQKGE